MNLITKSISYFFSIIGHPMLVVMYVLFLYKWINPYLFPYSNGNELNTIFLIIFFTAVLIPAIGILLLIGVGFVDNLHMEKSTERVGPLIIISICYLWLYLNIRTHSAIPISYSNFILGAIIALFVAFFINNFSKISLHGVGIGGLIIGSFYLLIKYGQKYTYLSIDDNSTFMVHSLAIILVILIFSGLVLSSRLLLKAHTNQDIIGGVTVGALGQFIAIGFF